MGLKMCYAALRWRSPDLPAALAALKESGWDGWEGRLPLDWLGPPSRVRRVCAEAGMPLLVYTATGSPDNREAENVEHNRRRMEFAAEMEADCFMFMNGPKPEARPVVDDDVRAAAEGAEEWAEYAAGLGLEISFHIHTNLLVDSAAHWKLYMSCLRKAGLCIDVSHAQLWGYDAAQSLRDFRAQLNYVHLQDYASCTRGEDGRYNPVWVSVGEAECMDFGGVMGTVEEIGFDRVVTCCPGEPAYEGEDAVAEAKRSAKMRQYMVSLGY
ncbi:MAG: sugar phosphate isomerase/epimerase [Candidatus Latescibacteria bacterium]|jgi:sugar phosphate isomerase/epimerase|nr:sugar phosphate isomerase/epimerase [Candidatus Latescibacterota bacterium]